MPGQAIRISNDPHYTQSHAKTATKGYYRIASTRLKAFDHVNGKGQMWVNFDLEEDDIHWQQ